MQGQVSHSNTTYMVLEYYILRARPHYTYLPQFDGKTNVLTNIPIHSGIYYDEHANCIRYQLWVKNWSTHIVHHAGKKRYDLIYAQGQMGFNSD